MDDMQLLGEYVARGSQEAFRRLVGLYVNLVYSAAVRQVHDRQTAEDVTQVVFMILARKAARLRARSNLSGWLLSVTHFAAREAIRAESRRKRHMRRLTEMTPAGGQPATSRSQEGTDWERVGPHLDAAMARLGEVSRAAVVLRFFENQSYEQVARRLRISEPAARQRVSRALGQLRSYLARRGVVASADGLGVLMVAHAVRTAPAELPVRAAGAAVKGAGISARHAALAKGTIIGMVPLGAKAAVVTLVVAVIACSSAAVYRLAVRRPVTLTAIAPGKSDARTKAVHGVVVGPGGAPVPGALVLLAETSHPANVYGTPRGDALSVRTGSDGSFEFPARPDATAVVVRATEGYAQMLVDELSNRGTVPIAPWGRIEGTVRAGGKPAAGRTVELARLGGTLETYNRWRIIHENRTKTDEFGNFTFPQVFASANDSAGDWMIHFADPAQRVDWYQTVKVTPRHTTFLMIGAGGRSVIGRVAGGTPGAFTGTLAPELARPSSRPATAPSSAPDPALPSIRFSANPDGSFRLDGVPPGTYRLTLRTVDRPQGTTLIEDVARAETVLTVASGDGQSSDPVDVGVLEPRQIEMLRPGDRAPDFSAVLADGSARRIRLEELRGKYVLLYFRYLGERQPWGAAGQLKALFDCFGGDGTLAIFDVTIDQDFEGAVKYRAANAIPWTVAAARMGGKLPPVYLSSATRMYLLDPEGKVVARSLTAKSAYAAMDAVLHRQDAGPSGIRVDIDHRPPGAGGPAAALGDPANVASGAAFSVVDGDVCRFSAPIDVLHDGRLAGDDNQTGSNFFFEFGSLEGRFRCDLGRPVEVAAVRTHSRHKDARGPQVYKLYGSDGTAPGFVPAPKTGTDPAACGWRLIAAVDTRPSAGAGGGQYTVTLSNPSGALGTFRHLLFEVFPTETRDDWGHTFFSEIEVLKK